ncbi:hypothetical protein P879_03768 [Paragonimus westermani]|uniref:ubiquitinyl hydrolase 1 n=1 Tax=Paragonimus westermani TaxID=34504 RepID=A0A8T0DTU4_9TREM|nr:hypothetical protein P879_03768 [Paragonimus westermani]
MGKRHKCVKYFRQQQQQRLQGSAQTFLDGSNVKVLKKHSYFVKGLHNVGNTCYLNSSVQCLSRSPCFHEVLSLPALRSATLKKPDGESIATMHITLPIMKASVTTRFYELAGQLREVRSDSYATTLNPGSLREAILERYPRFSGFGQQDSHELLRALLDCMKQEELMRWRKGILDKLNLDMKNIQPEDRELVRSWGRAASIATVVDRLFGGILVCSLQCCVCGTIRTTFEPFLDLSLPIADSKAPIGRRVSEGSRSHRGTGKSKQDLKRERKKKHKNPKREKRGKRKELNDPDVVSSDFDYECPPIAVEDNVTKTDSDVCEAARQDGSVADIPLVTSTPNDVYETGGDSKRRFSYEQTGSDVSHEQLQSNEPGDHFL